MTEKINTYKFFFSFWKNNKFDNPYVGFPDALRGKESASGAGLIPGLIPGSGRSLEKEMATSSSILAWEIPWTEEPGGYSLWGHRELDATEQHTLKPYIG